MKRSSIVVGQRFFKLTVIGESPMKRHSTRVYCKCDCGVIKDYDLSYLKMGTIKSCGCFSRNRKRLENVTHDMSSTNIYRIYQGMIQRCYNPKTPEYKNYGGRGIVVCDRWLQSFENFFSDMGDRPSQKHSLDRYPNNDGNYEPGNVRWATTAEQRRNSRSNVFFEINGIKMTQYDWTLYFGVSRNAIGNLIKNGKTFADVYELYSKKYGHRESNGYTKE